MGIAAFLALPAALRADNCTSSSNLVTNCTFEANDANGWNVTKAALGTDIQFMGNGNNGDGSIDFGAGDNEYDTISQMLGTTAGAGYTLSFWLADYTGNGPDSQTDFQALWNGVSVLDQNTTTPTANNGFVQFTFDVTGIGNDILTFEGYNAPSFYYLSDISVVANGETSTVTPEPSSLLLLGTGLVGFAGMLRRRFV
jgi:hypothetical protein